MGRVTQGVIVMRLRGDETVSSLAPVVESEEPEPADEAVATEEGAEPIVAEADFDEPDEDEDDDEDDEPDDEPDADEDLDDDE
jgi:hypothetical protein